MRGAYLCAHYKGVGNRMEEQVYFTVSRDGYFWESVNGGKPILCSELGEGGVRDVSIFRTNENRFILLGNDLCLSTQFEPKYGKNWANIGRFGSKKINMWISDDLVSWSEQKQLSLGDENFGCFWGPEILFNEETKQYRIYWSSSHADNDFGNKSIYYCETKDFVHFSEPVRWCTKEDASIVDPFVFCKDGVYYRFLKSRNNPFSVILEKSDRLDGEYKRVESFEQWMAGYQANEYEAPTIYELPGGDICLILDYFGEDYSYKGMIPFVTKDLETGIFVENSDKFVFPYGMKHGNIMEITQEEYERLKSLGQ